MQKFMAALIDWHWNSKLDLKGVSHQIVLDHRRDDQYNGNNRLVHSVFTLSVSNSQIPLTNFSKTFCCGAEFLLHRSEKRSPFLQLACRRPWGGNRPATRMGAPHLTHFCVHGPPARLCETNSLFSTSRARSMLWRGAHCTALPRQWGHMGNRRMSRSPFQRTTNAAAHYAWQRSL